MIYLLHFEPPVRSAKHYLGFCAEDRLDARMKEHARGVGASLTRAAIRKGATVYLVRTFPGGGPDLERTMKTHGHFRLMCPLCCPLLSRLKSEAHAINFARPDQPAPRAVLDWRDSPNNPRNHKQKGTAD